MGICVSTEGQALMAGQVTKTGQRGSRGRAPPGAVLKQTLPAPPQVSVLGLGMFCLQTWRACGTGAE